MKTIGIAGLTVLLATGLAYAEDSVWVATISLDGRNAIEIVDAAEAGCNAQVAQYIDAIVVEGCHAESMSLRITDPNDANKSTRTVRPRR